MQISLNMTTKNQVVCVRNIMQDMEQGLINVNPPYQRNEVWSSRKGQREDFICTILDNEPTPQMTFQTIENRLDVVDGKNRILAMYSFSRDEYPVTFDNNSYMYSSLPSHLKNVFNESEISLLKLPDTWTREKVCRYFAKLQKGMDLSKGEHIRSSPHPLAALARDISEEEDVKTFILDTAGGVKEKRGDALKVVIFIAQKCPVLKPYIDGKTFNITLPNIDAFFSSVPYDIVEANELDIREYIINVIDTAYVALKTPSLSKIFESRRARVFGPNDGGRHCTNMTLEHIYDIAYMVSRGFDSEVVIKVLEFAINRTDLLAARKIFVPACTTNSVLTKKHMDERENAIEEIYRNLWCIRKRRFPFM